MNILYRKLKAICKEKKGVTLIELVVCFMLISLLVTGVTQMVIISMRVYHDIRDMNQAYQVSDTLLDKISGEIEGAQGTLRIEDENKKIDLYDRTGSHIYITVDEKRLLIYYYEVVSEKEEGNQRITRYEAVDWKYDEKAYMGYEIEALTFRRSDAYPPNVIIVTLTLGKNGEKYVSRTRYVECYNFQDALDFAKIEGGK